MHRVDLLVLDQEVAPEPPAHEREHLRPRAGLEIVLEVREAGRLLRRQRPLAHLLVGSGGEVDPSRRLARAPVLAGRRELDPRRLLERVEEAVDPAALPAVGARARPEAELLPIVPHQRQVERGAAAVRPNVAVREPPQVADHLFHRRPRDEVAQPLEAGEDRQRNPGLLGDVVAEEVRLLEPHGAEVGVVDDGVPHARLADRPREVRLPDPLGQPEALGGGAKLRGDRPGELLDLAALVRIRDGGEDRFVVATGEDLDLPAGGQGPDPPEEVGSVGLEPVEERPGIMERQADPGVAFQRPHERGVRVVRGPGHDVVEVPDRLMVVDRERQDDRVHREGQPASPPPAARAGDSSTTLPDGM